MALCQVEGLDFKGFNYHNYIVNYLEEFNTNKK
jgi:hypothetical protein